MNNALEFWLDASAVHPEWRPILQEALKQVDQDYLEQLKHERNWLPGSDKLLAAFQRDLSHCRYILFGESPYPRTESANGIAFHDAAVTDLWSDRGLSKSVNRATSLRNILKTMLLAEKLIEANSDGSIPQSLIAEMDKTRMIQSIGDLFAALHANGFLMFNATPVLHPQRPVPREARYWHPFCETLLDKITEQRSKLPTLVLWGKIAEKIMTYPASQQFPILRCEHPYNLSFIHNTDMLELFATLKLLHHK